MWFDGLSAEIGSTDPLAAARHYQRGLAIAQKHENDWWTASAYELVVLATTNQVAAFPPAEAAGLLAEAVAAYRRCHTVLPWRWVTELKQAQLAGRAMRPAIEAHSQRGAAGWDIALRQLGSQVYSEGSAAVWAYGNATVLPCAALGVGGAAWPCAAALTARVPCTAGGSQAEGRWWYVMPCADVDTQCPLCPGACWPPSALHPRSYC